MRTIKDISHADDFAGRYLVASDTPDGGRSVYPECFGYQGLAGRVTFAADNLALAVNMLDRHAFVLDRVTGREIAPTAEDIARARATAAVTARLGY